MGFPIRKSLDQSPFAAPQGLSQRTTSFIASQHQGIHRIPLSHLIDLIIHAHPRPASRRTYSAGLDVLDVRTTFSHPDTRPRHAITHKSQACARPPGIEETPGLKTSLLQLYPQECLQAPEAEAKGPCLRSSTTFIRSGSKREETKPKPRPKHPDPELAIPKNGNRIESLFTMLNHVRCAPESGIRPRRPEGHAAEPNLSAPRPQAGKHLNLFMRTKWWSLTGSNRRHPACKAGALPAELRPL